MSKEKMQNEIDNLRLALKNLVRHVEINTCTHEETYRGGVLWEICSQCGSKWADDEGGKPDFKWPKEIEKARYILANK